MMTCGVRPRKSYVNDPDWPIFGQDLIVRVAFRLGVAGFEVQRPVVARTNVTSKSIELVSAPAER